MPDTIKLIAWMVRITGGLTAGATLWLAEPTLLSITIYSFLALCWFSSSLWVAHQLEASQIRAPD